MKDPSKIRSEKEVDELEIEKEFEEEKLEKINWMRIIVLGFITSIVFILVDLLIVMLLVFGFDNEWLFVLDFMQYIVFGEAALVIFIGACLGNFGQSVAVSKLKTQFFGSDTFDKNSFREATFNAFTYYAGGFLLLVYSMILWQVLKIAVTI